MSVPLHYIRDRVRGRLRDLTGEKPKFDSIEYDQAICEAYLELQAILPAPDLYTASAFTISAGAHTFTLPATVTQYTGGAGGAEYANDVRIQLATSGQFLRKLRTDEMDELFDGAATIPTSIPDRFDLWETKSQSVTGRCWPGALAAQVCNLYAALSADDLRDFVGSGTDDMDDVQVLFSRIAANALVLYVAGDLGERPDWQQRAHRLLYKEAERRHSLDSVGRTQRRVS